MIELFKIINGHTQLNTDKMFIFTCKRHDAQTRASAGKFLVSKKCRLDLRKYFFTNRVIRPWNDLPKAYCPEYFNHLPIAF